MNLILTSPHSSSSDLIRRSRIYAATTAFLALDPRIKSENDDVGNKRKGDLGAQEFVKKCRSSVSNLGNNSNYSLVHAICPNYRRNSVGANDAILFSQRYSVDRNRLNINLFNNDIGVSKFRGRRPRSAQRMAIFFNLSKLLVDFLWNNNRYAAFYAGKSHEVTQKTHWILEAHHA